MTDNNELNLPPDAREPSKDDDFEELYFGLLFFWSTACLNDEQKAKRKEALEAKLRAEDR